MNIKEQQKIMADAFTSVTGGGCGCGYNMLLDNKQAQLDKILLTLEGEK
jgi:hypothetical protein